MADPAGGIQSRSQLKGYVQGVHVALIDAALIHEWFSKQRAELEAKGREIRILRPSWSTWPEEPPWLVARRRFWWIAGGVGSGVLLLAAAATLTIILRRRRRRLAKAEVEDA